RAADELENNKQSNSLNLNNEVVKLRKEVKRVRTLIIRKLTRQIGGLKKKKGKEMEIDRNQRRAARLLEEIHAMKALLPDVVTKTALQKNLNFELVCKNPKSTISDRAVARIATHPQFSKKIEAIKSAVKAFKDERTKQGKQMFKEKMQNKVKKGTPPVRDKEGEKEEEVPVEPQKSEKGDDVSKDPVNSTFVDPEKETVKELVPRNVKPATGKIVNVRMKNKPQGKNEEKKARSQSAFESEGDDVESELESSDEEDQQYFDDSTEERFHKQSSQSEDSDSDNGFFVGKVRKFKKKKQKEESETGPESQDGPDTKADKNSEVKGKPDPKQKAAALQSVFCSSLAKRAPGRGAGRGGNTFRGNPKGNRGMQRDFGKRQRAHRGGGGFSRQAPQQALHPSWEASRKRKEQQGQIAFQGKKIKFDD
uniref:Serum response factor-binding protein 1 n=1 Tax=Tetraodon nigroviridis TaxID=99883 RepID=H3CV48_TETNG